MLIVLCMLCRYNAPRYYFECRLLALQWLRGENTFRWGRVAI